MHRALLLHEIIGEILQAGKSTRGFLHTCLFITKPFSYEALRILWNRCGRHRNYATAGCIDPKLSHLGKIVLQNPERAQFYANFIHVLGFDDEVNFFNLLDDSHWYLHFAALQFPNLEDVAVYRSAHSAVNAGDVVTQYAQPKLKSFALWEGYQLSDSSLATLSHSCPDLKSLDLRRMKQNGVSSEGLVHFLDFANALVDIRLGPGFNNCWSRRAFDALSRHVKMRSICIPDIQDDWIQTLRDTSHIKPAFPNLKEFRGGCSDLCLQELAQYLPCLESLELWSWHRPSSHQLLASVSNLTNLTKLVIHLMAKDSVTGYDLILFTRKTPELVVLSIGDIGSSHPMAYGITDNVMGQVAQNLPKISQLSLKFSQSDMLTWQSILSFARHCKKLEVLKLSCNFSWRDAIGGVVDTAFDSLWCLEVLLDVNSRDEQIANDPADVQAVVERFAVLAPLLISFTIQGGNDADDALGRAIDDMCTDGLLVE